VKRAQLEANVLVLVTLGLVAFGLVMVYSATSARAAVGDGEPMHYLTRQAIFALAGLVALVVCARTPYSWWRRAAPSLVAVTIILLAAVLVMGDPVNGARRWLPFGPFVFQPSEPAKLALAVWTAAYLSRSRRRPPATLGELARPLGLVAGVSAGLILLEPDLGTAVAIMLMLGGILIAAGTPVGLLARGGGIVVFLGLAAIWLEPYRRERIFSFFNPWSDAQGAGFQSVQALIGLGSGGVFGKGIGEGVQKIFYLPEAHTDMIFATIGEELGLIGTVGVIAAFAAFCWAGMRIAVACPDRFGSLLAAGLTVLIGAQAATNLAAVLGLAPVTGITLPFVSYGGSSLVVALAGAGILLNIAGTDARAKRAEVPDRSRGDRRPRAAVARGGGGLERPRSTRDVRRVAGARRSATRP
jgi:cell division protein FtsW